MASLLKVKKKRKNSFSNAYTLYEIYKFYNYIMRLGFIEDFPKTRVQLRAKICGVGGGGGRESEKKVRVL